MALSPPFRLEQAHDMDCSGFNFFNLLLLYTQLSFESSSALFLCVDSMSLYNATFFYYCSFKLSTIWSLLAYFHKSQFMMTAVQKEDLTQDVALLFAWLNEVITLLNLIMSN
jgi:hypothetical protein